jgi:chromosomal replication initiation ATPase DnaA
MGRRRIFEVVTREKDESDKGADAPIGRQLVFDLTPKPRFGAEDFLISASNEAAYAWIELWPNWPDQVLLLIGPRGAGKSHLGAIWAVLAKARVLPASALQAIDPHELATGEALLIEDADQIGAAEAGLFHLLNLMRERGASLVLTARGSAATWGLQKADLLSRLRLAPSVELGAPDDALMRAVLVKLFVDRQLVVDTSLIDYAALRLDRSLDAARSFIAALDQEALSRGRRITRTMAADVLTKLTGEEDPGGD